ncbi:MAG: hypothetical protein ACMZI0_08750 [Symbiopectobacterium sp.]|uniref:hypothetical protein n=1 Tax=Symbiopectobacterium sp. TaxID=2952789 RepID=UPI0039EB370E
MMTPFAWLALSLALYLAGALLSLCLARNDALAIKLSGVCALLAGLAGIGAALPVLTSAQPLIAAFDIRWPICKSTVGAPGRWGST